jgi:lantibiotic leader peptide-processing serine protease
MRRFSVLTILGAFTLGACADDTTAPVSTPAPRSPSPSVGGSGGASDTYLVRFRGNGVPDGFAADIARLGGEVIFAHPIGIAAVAGLDDKDAAALARIAGVAAVDADAYVTLDESAGEVTADVGTASPSDPTTSAAYARQWNMRAIGANLAWAAGQLGSPTVRVGVLDTGIDYLHPDLFGRVDLTASRSYLSAAENARVPAGAHVIADLHYHGTHVAATIASNGLAAAGVTSRVTLVGLKVCAPGTPANGFTAGCPVSSTLAAILDAADMGLDVINMSLGGAFRRVDGSARGGFGPSFVATLNQVLNYANRKGTAIVVAAGNSSFDLGRNIVPVQGGTAKLPGLYGLYCDAPAVICVSATGPTAQASINGPWANVDAFAPYSNFGRGAIDVAAPGGNVSAVWAACSGFTLVPSLAACRARVFDPATGAWSAFVVGLAGTSMASAHVTGTAAIIAGFVGHNPSQIQARLQQTADDLGQSGNDPAYGHGRINVARAAGVQ